MEAELPKFKSAQQAAFEAFYPAGDWESVNPEGRKIWVQVATAVISLVRKADGIANEIQIGGNHYKQGDPNSEEHWDRVARLGLDYFQGCITKYVERCWKKNRIEDLKKARHYLDKYIELKEASTKESDKNDSK